MTTDNERKAFAKVMADSTMPDDSSWEYDWWLFDKAWQAAKAEQDGWLPINEEAKKHPFVELYYDHGEIELATFQQNYWRQKCDHSLMLTPFGITHYRIPQPPKQGE